MSSQDRAAAKRKVLAEVRQYAAKGMADGLRPRPSKPPEATTAPTPPELSDADVAAALASVEV